MLLIGRNGMRQFIAPSVTKARISLGLRRAAYTGRIFHLWFHPSNFYHQQDSQFDILTHALETATAMRRRNQIDIKPMSDYAS